MSTVLKEEDRLLTTSQVAKHVRVSPRTVATWVGSGELPTIRFSRRCVRIDPRDLNAFIKRKRSA